MKNNKELDGATVDETYLKTSRGSLELNGLREALDRTVFTC